VVKGLRIIYEDNSDGISFIQSFVPFMHDVDKRVTRELKQPLIAPNCFFIEFVPNCVKNPP